MGCAVLPHLRQMVEIVEHGLVDEQQKVRALRAFFCFCFISSSNRVTFASALIYRVFFILSCLYGAGGGEKGVNVCAS